MRIEVQNNAASERAENVWFTPPTCDILGYINRKLSEKSSQTKLFGARRQFGGTCPHGHRAPAL